MRTICLSVATNKEHLGSAGAILPENRIIAQKSQTLVFLAFDGFQPNLEQFASRFWFADNIILVMETPFWTKGSIANTLSYCQPPLSIHLLFSTTLRKGRPCTCYRRKYRRIPATRFRPFDIMRDFCGQARTIQDPTQRAPQSQTQSRDLGEGTSVRRQPRRR